MAIPANIKSKLMWLLSLIKFAVNRAFSVLYDYAISYPITMKVYKHMLNQKFLKDFSPNIKPGFKGEGTSIIDIGTGPGTCLNSILDQCNFSRVLAVDIDKNYVNSAKKLF